MHVVDDPRNIIDPHIATSSELGGKQCSTCLRLLAYGFYERDNRYKDGRRAQCIDCESQPWLSTSEHVARMKEMNYSSPGTNRQRFAHQADYEDPLARQGKRMSFSEFRIKLHDIVPQGSLFFTDGNFIGDIAIYRVSGKPRPDYDGPNHDYKYMFYCSAGIMPEFSTYEFNELDIPLREKERGWRTILLRFINSGLTTEEQVNWEFGKAEGIGATVYLRKLYEHRNRVTI